LIYGTEKPFSAILPSMAFLQGDDELEKSMRLALTLFLLKPHERELIGSLMLSLAGRELGDARLSGLMSFAKMMTVETAECLRKLHGLETASLEEIVRGLSQSASNFGNTLKFNEDGEVISGTPLYPEPPDAA
jgi:hypothetical protein